MEINKEKFDNLFKGKLFINNEDKLCKIVRGYSKTITEYEYFIFKPKKEIRKYESLNCIEIEYLDEYGEIVKGYYDNLHYKPNTIAYIARKIKAYKYLEKQLKILTNENN